MAITFTLEPNEAQLVANALSALPYGQVASLIAKLSAQLAEQAQPKPAPPPAPLDDIDAKAA